LGENYRPFAALFSRSRMAAAIPSL
jgi:hypothetical protein